MLSLIELLNLMYERGGTLTIYRDPSSRGHTAIQIEQAQTKHFGIEIVSDADLRASGGVLLLHALEKVVGKVRAAGKNDAPPTQEATMACPTCDATVHCITPGFSIADDGTKIGSELKQPAQHLCPRCGTVKSGDGQVYVPKLVERVREFVTLGLGSFGPADAGKRQTFLQALSVTGVLEAAFLPDDRPKP